MSPHGDEKLGEEVAASLHEESLQLEAVDERPNDETPVTSTARPRHDLIAIIIFLSIHLVDLLLKQPTGFYNPYGSSSTTLQTQVDRSPANNKTRLLYIVTSSSQYNSQRRKHIRHQNEDRLMKMIVPVVREGIESFVKEGGYEVDLYLILSYSLTEDRETRVRDRLSPFATSIEIWNYAVPYCYEQNMQRSLNETNIQHINRALARQHRFVTRDKLLDYDVFVAFEDDMLIKAAHIEHHLYMSRLIDDLRLEAPVNGTDNHNKWFGTMSKNQFPRMRPGFIRVEVLMDGMANQTQETLENVPLDFDFGDLQEEGNNSTEIDASVCCQVTEVGQNVKDASMRPPVHPNSSRIMLWEAGIEGMYVREMPFASSEEQWWGLMPGGDSSEKLFSGDLRNLTSDVPPHHAKLLAQSAGWIMTRKQLVEMHTDLCQGSFLPPFDEPTFLQDGLFINNVEFWSGGLQMWTFRKGCSIQRVLQLSPQNMSRHLLYHTGNNKQLQRERDRRVLANTLLGQFNTIRKDAIAKKREVLLLAQNN